MAQIPPVPPVVDPAAPADPPAAPPTAPPVATEPPPAAPTEPPTLEPPSTLTLTSEQLKDRLERAQATDRARWLKEQGFDDEAAFAARVKQFEDATAAAEEAKRLEMTEIEKYKADLATAQAATEAAEAKATASEEAAEAARTEAHLRGLFADRGIVNSDYAFHLVQKAQAELADGAELDEVALLDGLMADEQQKLALGIAAPPPAEGLAQTATPVTAPPPVPATPGTFDAMTATPADWAARKKELGIS